MKKLLGTNILKGDKYFLLFIAIVLIFSTFYYDSILGKGPMNTHFWRQVDCLSVTQNYEEGASFFEPQLNCLFADDLTTGKTAGEFPLLYFIAGKIWSFFGTSYFSFRLFYLLILFAGLISFYQSLRIIIKDPFWSISIALLLFTSPAFVTYGISFLTDVPAFCILLIGLYVFLKYYQKRALHLLYISCGLFALAGLIKVSSLIAFVCLLSILLLESFFKVNSLGKRRLFLCSKHEWIGFMLVPTTIIAWYAYVYNFNVAHGFKFTYNHTEPLWKIHPYSIDFITSRIINFTSPVFYSRPMIWTLIGLGIFNLTLWKKVPTFAYLCNFLAILGSLTYLVLWTKLISGHDYYWTQFLVLLLGTFPLFIWYLKHHHASLFKSMRLKAFFCLFVLFNFGYCHSVVQLKTTAEKGNFFLVGNRKFVDEMTWVNWDIRVNWYRYAEMKPFMEEHNIKPDDKIISLPDGSFNNSLFLLGRKGWTGFRPYQNIPTIKRYIDKGAKYLFIADNALLESPDIAPFLTSFIGEFRGIYVYALAKFGLDKK